MIVCHFVSIRQCATQGQRLAYVRNRGTMPTRWDRAMFEGYARINWITSRISAYRSGLRRHGAKKGDAMFDWKWSSGFGTCECTHAPSGFYLRVYGNAEWAVWREKHDMRGADSYPIASGSALSVDAAKSRAERHCELHWTHVVADEHRR